MFAVALSANLVERLEGDVLDVQALDGLEVDGEVAGVDGREVQPKRKTTTLTKLNLPGKQAEVIRRQLGHQLSGFDGKNSNKCFLISLA